MKNLILFIASLLITVISKAQITLEYSNDTVSFGEQFYCLDIGDNEYKYFMANSNTNSFSLYNLDMSPFLTNINLPSADSIKNGCSVAYISRTLFDCDSSTIEYAYESPTGSKRLPFYVLRTDGTLLLKVDSARGPYCFGCWGGAADIRPIKHTDGGTKLFLDKLNPSGTGILVYSLCGKLPTGYFTIAEPKSFVNLYPNPTSSEVCFEIQYPSNIEGYHLIIIDELGHELQRAEMTAGQTRYSLNVSGFSSGTYFYSFSSKSNVYQTGKFIINR
ncbi:MAG: T9SS type A sorting domain-containing protein [Chitinophagales bacterium]